MSQNQLDRAYDLIKAGDKQAAIDLLEPIIRADRDNDDAWWLLANATDDPESKRNALNNVLRIGTNDTREARAQEMLDILDNIGDEPEDALYDDYDLRDHPTQILDSNAEKSGEKSSVLVVRNESNGCATLAKIFGGVMVLFGMCACVSCFAFFNLAQGLVEAPPANQYELLDTISLGSTVEGTIGVDDWDAYTFETTQNESVIFDVIANPNTVFVVPLIYSGNDELAFDGVRGFTGDSTSTELAFTAPASGEYLLLIRSFFADEPADYTLVVREQR